MNASCIYNIHINTHNLTSSSQEAEMSCVKNAVTDPGSSSIRQNECMMYQAVNHCPRKSPKA